MEFWHIPSKSPEESQLPNVVSGPPWPCFPCQGALIRETPSSRRVFPSGGPPSPPLMASLSRRLLEPCMLLPLGRVSQRFLNCQPKKGSHLQSTWFHKSGQKMDRGDLWSHCSVTSRKTCTRFVAALTHHVQPPCSFFLSEFMKWLLEDGLTFQEKGIPMPRAHRGH